MRVKALVISGTLAPKLSCLYYEDLLATSRKFVNTCFETIPGYGLGMVEETVIYFAEKYFLQDSDTHYILVGHSQGGDIASLLAMMFPGRILSVITLATPFMGTTLVDPVNMPLRIAVELINILSSGRIKLRPKLPHFQMPSFPIVGDLAAHSQMSEKICAYLKKQTSYYQTHAFIGTGDVFVFPHRSANPSGPNVTNYIVAPLKEYQRLVDILPPGIVHIDAHVGHLMIARKREVLGVVEEIISECVEPIGLNS